MVKRVGQVIGVGKGEVDVGQVPLEEMFPHIKSRDVLVAMQTAVNQNNIGLLRFVIQQGIHGDPAINQQNIKLSPQERSKLQELQAQVMTRQADTISGQVAGASSNLERQYYEAQVSHLNTQAQRFSNWAEVGLRSQAGQTKFKEWLRKANGGAK